MDVNSVFLNEDLFEEVYILLSHGFTQYKMDLYYLLFKFIVYPRKDIQLVTPLVYVDHIITSGPFVNEINQVNLNN